MLFTTSHEIALKHITECIAKGITFQCIVSNKGYTIVATRGARA